MTGAGRKKKILYLMHVDWNWIKQRPHFLAEGLSSSYDVLVLYHYSSDRSVLVKNSTTIKHYPIPRMPFGRFSLIAKANVVFQRIFFTLFLKIYNPDIVWITFPSLYGYVAESDMRNRTLVYDCMDDAVEFIDDDNYRKSIHNVEQRVLERVDIVFASSQHLISKLGERGCESHKLALVRNAFDSKTLLKNKVNNHIGRSLQNAFNRICFVGSIGDHLDFDAILYCVHQLSSVEFHFIGPVVCDVPVHGRLVFHGPANHGDLANIVQQYDSMILPFKVNDLIRGVDPVKLYDYINFGKNIISIYYDEIKRFDNFVFFYQNRENLVQVISQVSGLVETKYSSDERQQFLKLNSWSERVPSIVKFLN